MTANLAGEKPPVVGVLSDCESWLYQEAARSDFWQVPTNFADCPRLTGIAEAD
jgi:hypothetical protein